MEKFEVVMIGNTAVGKTSMLAALAKELDAYNISGPVALEPTTHEFKIIQKQWIEMTEQVESQAPFTTLSTGIEGALTDFVEHKFDFKVDGSKEATVLFTDTRGTITGDPDEWNTTGLIERVNNAFGVFCVVDASVLMECKAYKNEQYNCPDVVKRLLKSVYCDDDDKQPRFVAFVLIKCEKYMATKKGQKELSEAFHKVYDNIVDMLKKVDVPPNVYALAIQTMTCVSFLKLNDTTGLPEFRVLPAKKLKTKDCAYPLVILLKELIDAIGQERRGSIIHIAIDKLLILFGIRKNLKKYLAEVDKHIALPDLYEEL
jgi:hypothetical protein